MSVRVLIVGCGGIGGNLGAGLAGHPRVSRLVAVSSNPAIAAAVNADGFVVDGQAHRGEVVAEAPAGETFDFVLLATQPPQVEAAARTALPALAPDGAMVVLQNGLCERRIAAIAGDDRVIGAVVAWGAAMDAPGRYRRTSSGGFVLGRPDGREDPRLSTLADVLSAVGPTEVTTDLAGYRWSKLAINCAISTLGTIEIGRAHV